MIYAIDRFKIMPTDFACLHGGLNLDEDEGHVWLRILRLRLRGWPGNDNRKDHVLQLGQAICGHI